MIAPIPGPDAPPRAARQCRIGTWGGGLGVFWQHGASIGVIWTTVPAWGQVTPRLRAYHHVLGSAEVARRYFDLMSESMREMRPDLRSVA